jgi:hypothetical protein
MIFSDLTLEIAMRDYHRLKRIAQESQERT